MKALRLSAMLLCATALPAAAQVVFPNDASDTCGVDAATFDTWFESGTASKDGKVDPADSFVFPPIENTKCDFYQWGAQMFLWLTSPDGGVPVLDSSVFYDVVANGSGFEFQLSDADHPTVVGVRTMKGNDIGGGGQAGGDDALISDASSVTFFGIHANDVYAHYLTQQMAGAFTGTPLDTNFPISEAEVQAIEKAAGLTFSDAKAMTMELKTAWVDASTVDASQFVTMAAVVPDFDQTTSPTSWPSNGATKEVTLALVGLHIAAPVQGHPELVWSSFEHINNAPLAEYFYTNSSGTVSTPYSSSGSWLYIPSGTPEPATLVSSAKYDSSAVALNVTNGAAAIGPVPVVQKNPWGNAPTNDTATVASNTDLLSLNVSVLGMLNTMEDVRANYYQLGGIWTVKGQLPSGGSDTNNRGGLFMANTSMETFHQYTAQNTGVQNCFTCHSTSSTSGQKLSHIYDALSPLE
ncbi:MAG: hypothetical protein LJE68_02505 [Rhodobacter sp.]|nr:hypothetical protein [Rhodobacter sp.]